MTVLKHPLIRGMIQISGTQPNPYISSPIDGWFHELSSQWPGQAMSLKVRIDGKELMNHAKLYFIS